MDDEDISAELERLVCLNQPEVMHRAWVAHGWPARGLAITPPGLPRLAHRARAEASSCATLARRCDPHRCAEDSVFDRLLAAQAELEGLHLVSLDPALATFPCRLLW